MRTTRLSDGSEEFTAASDEKIMMQALNDSSNPDADNGEEVTRGPSRPARVAKFVLVNGTGWGAEYTFIHAGFIVTNPQLYQHLWDVASNYFVSPFGLMGRGLIWGTRGLLAIAFPSERPDNIKAVLRTAGFDLAAWGLIGLTYWAGSSINKHTQLLIEVTFVDSFVISATSAALRLGTEIASECYSNTNWQFWQRRTHPHPIGLDERLTPPESKEDKESPPTPIVRLGAYQGPGTRNGS
jgi:hypothetical protein